MKGSCSPLAILAQAVNAKGLDMLIIRMPSDGRTTIDLSADIARRLSGQKANIKKETVAMDEVVEKLLDAAFSELQHDTGPNDPEYVYQRKVLKDRFVKIIGRRDLRTSSDGEGHHG